jgi:hypothetical protein
MGMKSGSTDKAECRLWVQKGDHRRNAPQRARSAESGQAISAAVEPSFRNVLYHAENA